MTDPERADDVTGAMVAVDRRAFLPAGQRAHADEDRPLPLGLGQTCSQPSTVAAMLRLLRVPVGGRVLDVGAGSGVDDRPARPARRPRRQRARGRA